MPGEHSGDPYGLKNGGNLPGGSKKNDAPDYSNPATLLAMLQNGPSAEDLYNDAVGQVGGGYQAQLDLLAQQAQQAKGQQKAGDSQLAAMYAALQKDIKGGARGIADNYNQQAQSSQNAYNGGVNQINQAYASSQGAESEMLRRLGIQAAAPDVFKQGTDDRGFLSAVLRTRQSNDATAIHANKSSALNFNTSQANSAGLAGTNKRADLVSALNKTLGDISGRQSTVYGSMQDAIAQKQYSLEQDSVSRQKALYDELAASQKASDTAATAGQMTPSQQYAQMGPIDRGYYKAQQSFGTNADKAMQLIMSVANGGKQFANPLQFANEVTVANRRLQATSPGDALNETELQALAAYVWDQGGNNTSPNNYLGTNGG